MAQGAAPDGESGWTVAKRAREGSNKAQRYVGAIAVVYLLTLMLASAVALVVLRERLLQALADLLPGGVGLQGDDVPIVAIAGVSAFAAPVLAAAAAGITIRVLRLTLYVRRLHAHAENYLRTHAPLHGHGIVLEVIPFDESGSPSANARPAPLSRRLGTAGAILLLGESGAGKTAMLYGLASTLTRKRALATWLGSRRRLPVLISLDMAQGDESRGGSPVLASVAAQLRHFGSPGLASRAERLLRRGRIILLCDDLDAGPPGRRLTASRQLAALLAAYPRTPVVAACRLETYRDGLHTEHSLRRFERVVLSGLTSSQIASALRSLSRNSRATRPRRQNLQQTLERYALDAAAASPAGLLAIHTLLARGELVAGRGDLLSRYVGVLLGAIVADEPERERIETLLAALAAGLRWREERSLPAPADVTGAEMTGAEQEPTSADIAAEIASSLSDGAQPVPSAEVDAALAAALEAAILVRTAGDRVAFANGAVEAAFAARWLTLSDDGFGAIRTELLRPEWLLPLALHATSVAQPGDLAKRILRLADTPDTVALRARLSSPAEAVPHILAVAISVVAEGTVVAWARDDTSAGVAAGAQSAALAAEHLRDVLDLAHIYLAQPDGADRLAARLRMVAAHGGPDFVAALAQLAGDTRLSRLVRSQLIALLGLVADGASLEALAGLLADMDPLVRQSVNQAFVRAGPGGLERLRRVAQTQRGRLRERAGEVMALVGDDAVTAAIELLSHADEARRVTAAVTLGELRAARAEAALVERLTDRSDEVRLAAARALAGVGTIGARTALRALLDNGDPRLRAAGADALGSLRAEDAVRAIARLLDDSSADVRAAAVRALGSIGDDAVAEALLPRLSDDDLWVRQAAESALRRLGRTGRDIQSPTTMHA